MRNFKIITLLITSFFVISCNRSRLNKSKPINEYFKSMAFTPFTPPNDILTPMSIISYKKGQEVKAFSNDCEPKIIARIEESKTALLKSTITIKNDNDLDILLSPEILKVIDLKTALKDSIVKEISIEFIDPYIKVVSAVKGKEQILSSTKECIEQSKIKSNVIIHQVLGSKGLKFTFLSNGSKKITLTAKQAEIIGITPKFKQSLTGKSEINIDINMLYAYKGFDKQISSSLFEDDFIFIEMDSNNIEKLKEQSRE